MSLIQRTKLIIFKKRRPRLWLYMIYCKWNLVSSAIMMVLRYLKPYEAKNMIFRGFFPKWREFGFFKPRKTIFFVNLIFGIFVQRIGSTGPNIAYPHAAYHIRKEYLVVVKIFEAILRPIISWILHSQLFFRYSFEAVQAKFILNN